MVVPSGPEYSQPRWWALSFDRPGALNWYGVDIVICGDVREWIFRLLQLSGIIVVFGVVEDSDDGLKGP